MIFVLKQLVEKYREKRKDLHVAFIILEKTYDKAYREALRRVLHECGVDGYLIRGMSSLFNGSRACVRLGNRMKLKDENGGVWEVKQVLHEDDSFGSRNKRAYPA